MRLRWIIKFTLLFMRNYSFAPLIGFILFCLILLTACSSNPDPDFQVSMILVDAEESEDSNSQTETLTIDGYEGSYHWAYEGYTPNEDLDVDQEYSFELTDEQMHDLTLLIRENGLMVPREDTVSTGEPWSAFDLTWDMSMGGQSASGHVVGEPVSWEDWDSTGHDSFIEDESLFAGEAVFDYVRELVGFEP